MDDPQLAIEQLKSVVDTARQEIELAIMFHETWRPAAYDDSLHDRIGTSYAAHAFQIIRLSLRRELLLALTRLWDNDRRAVGIGFIQKRLTDPVFFDALVEYRARRLGLRSMFTPEAVRKELIPKRDQILDLTGKYIEGGSAFEVLKKLKMLRNQHLAHRQLPKAPVAAANSDTLEQPEEGKQLAWATDNEIETFYQDNLEIIRLLLSLVQGMAYDLSEATTVYKHHARFFWASARGERTEGHPDYRPLPFDS